VQAHLNLDDAATTAVTASKGKPIIVKQALPWAPR
jgi:hypothetical protein